jgi:hypothetical protein
METFRNQAFEGKSFILDQVVFVNCALRNCDLFYAGGDFEWVNTRFEDCRFHWRGAARNTLALLQVIGMLPPPAQPQAVIPPPSSQKLN